MPSLIELQQRALISPTEREKLDKFIDLILEWNSKINLTGFKTRERIEELLICESILAGKSLPKRAGNVLDFGSGAGIPGLVWAVTEPALQITSLEVRARKVAFQKEAVRLLSLPAEMILGRFPEAVEGRRFDLIVTRAIRFSPELWSAGQELLNSAGCLVRFTSKKTVETGEWMPIVASPQTTLLFRCL